MKRDSQKTRERLAAGPKRGLGCADTVAQEALADQSLLPELIAALADSRPTVVARAASALKKAQGAAPHALDRFARTLLQNFANCAVLEARWNLAIIIGGLPLRGRDHAIAVDLLFESLAEPSAFMRTMALQALVSLSEDDPGLQQRLRPVLQDFLTNGTAAMQARARKLLVQAKT